MEEEWKEIEALRKDLDVILIVVTSRINQLNDRMVNLRNKLKR